MIYRHNASSSRYWLLSAAACGLLLVAGCGPSRPETFPVSGVVTLDGKPVAAAAVLFSPVGGGRPARGTTDAEGKFKLMTFEPGDGALVGKHRVTVAKVKLTGKEDAPADEPFLMGFDQEWLTPAEYANPDTSGLTAEVKSEMTPLQLGLKSQ